MKKFNIDLILAHYLECLLWVNSDSNDDNDGMSGIAIYEIEPEQQAKAMADIKKFLELVELSDEAMKECEADIIDESYIGGNLFLSRNGHGAGFSDEYNIALQGIADNMGETYEYVGDDGKVYL